MTTRIPVRDSVVVFRPENGCRDNKKGNIVKNKYPVGDKGGRDPSTLRIFYFYVESLLGFKGCLKIKTLGRRSGKSIVI